MPAMRLVRLQSLPLVPLGVLYTCAHMVLDWLSYVHPFGAFGLTPWNPSTGFGFVLVLVLGRRALPILFTALLVSNLMIRGMPVPLWVAGTESLIVGVGYGLALLTLLHPSVGFDTSLSSVRDLFLLLVAAVASSAVVASTYVSLLIATDLLTMQDWSAALLRYWVGDMIGIAVVTPFGLLASTRDRLIKLDWESVLQIGSTISLTVWVVAVFAEHHQLQLFYLMFLPVTWIAVRSGIEGVSVALMSIQLGLVVAIVVFPGPAIDVFDFQARMLILAVTGLVAGMLVSERRLAEIRLRMNQDALAQVSRLGSMGELAAAIAHEINQPLSAASTYTGLVAESLEGETLRDTSTLGLARKAAVQIDRAADVVRRLRTLVRLGRSDSAPTSVATIVGETVDLARADLERQSIALKLEVASDLPLIMADRLQIEQVLMNLIRNSMDAITENNVASGQIVISAKHVDSQHVELTVSDTGPGFPSGFGEEDPLPLMTTKPEGLGIGLSLCRSIVEAHAGTLSIRSSRRGASVSVLLPISESSHHG
jgi:two-component system, LuxR family, sensor kinase FixL